MRLTIFSISEVKLSSNLAIAISFHVYMLRNDVCVCPFLTFDDDQRITMQNCSNMHWQFRRLGHFFRLPSCLKNGMQWPKMVITDTAISSLLYIGHLTFLNVLLIPAEIYHFLVCTNKAISGLNLDSLIICNYGSSIIQKCEFKRKFINFPCLSRNLSIGATLLHFTAF